MTQKEGKIEKFNISQRPEFGSNRTWPQLFELLLVYPEYAKEITVNLNAPNIELKDVAGLDTPLFVLFNSSGQGYGLSQVDAGMYNKLYTLQNPLNRASAYISMYENMLNDRSVKPKDLLTLLTEGLSNEKEELNLKLICGYLNSIYWEYITKQDRQSISAGLELAIWNALEGQTLMNNKRILFKTYQDVFLSKSAKDTLLAIWDQSKPAPGGLKMNEDDYTALAFALALRDHENSGILEKQLSRITNSDRIKRFEFIMPAVSADPLERDRSLSVWH